MSERNRGFKSGKTLRITSTVTFLGFLDTHILIPVMALYASELGASVAIVGLVVGLYSVTNTPANIFFGKVIDRFGYRMPLILGLLGDALSMFLYSICRIPMHLALVRAFHGVSGGLVGPSTMSATAKQAELSQRGKVMGFYGMAIGMATLVGYGLGGVIASRLGYKVLFYFGCAILLLGAFLAFLMPREETRTEAANLPSHDHSTIGELLKRRGLIASYCSIFAQYFSFGGVVVLLPLYVKGLGMNSFHVGILLATFAIVFAVLQFPSGVLSDKKGRRLPIVAGLCLGVLTILLLPNFERFATLAIIMALYGAGYALLFPSLGALIVDHTTAEERGRATGIFHALLTAGVAVGAPVMGWVAGLVGVELGLALSAVAMAMAIVVVSAALMGHSTKYS